LIFDTVLNNIKLSLTKLTKPGLSAINGRKVTEEIVMTSDKIARFFLGGDYNQGSVLWLGIHAVFPMMVTRRQTNWTLQGQKESL